MSKKVYLCMLVLTIMTVLVVSACGFEPTSGTEPSGGSKVVHYVTEDGRNGWYYVYDEQTHEDKPGGAVVGGEKSLNFGWYIAAKWSDEVYFFTEDPPFAAEQDAYGRMISGAWAYRLNVGRQCVYPEQVWVPVGTEGYGHVYECSRAICH